MITLFVVFHYFLSRYLKHPFSITVFEDLMYWSEWESHRIYQVRIN